MSEYYDAYYTAQKRSQGMVTQEIRAGRLPKLMMTDHNIICADCPDLAYVYEHRSYNHPLDVVATCCSCNILRGPANFDPKGPFIRHRECHDNPCQMCRSIPLQFNCEVCGHNWQIKRAIRPKMCPGCQSVEWEGKRAANV